MIEILLQAERALAMGLVDQAERLYRQAAAADARNSIAVVGLARVALERGDEATAWREARRALGIDPENVAASRLAERLEEVWAYRGQPMPSAEPAVDAAAPAVDAEPTREREPVEAAEPGVDAEPAVDAEPTRGREPVTNSTGRAPTIEKSEPPPPSALEPGPPGQAPAREPQPLTRPGPPTQRERGVVDRLLRRNRP
jgi:hypothetical protein